MKYQTTWILNGKWTSFPDALASLLQWGACCRSYFFILSSLHSVEALSEALSDWGEEDGAIVVISHDKNFCEKVGFTHVVTVQDGKLTMEQRQANGKDWDASVATLQPTVEGSDDGKDSSDNSGATAALTLDPKLRKKAYNAPKRIEKIEELVESKEQRVAALEAEMMTHGSDVEKLLDLTKEKEVLEAAVADLMEEWEELEGLLAQL